MGLPRHLRDRFNTEGNLIDGAPAGQTTTSTAPENDNLPAANDVRTPTPIDTPVTPAAPDNGASATPTVVDPEHDDAHVDDNSNGSPDANYRRMEGRYKAQIQRLTDQVADLQEAARGSSTVIDMLAELRAENATLRAAQSAKPDTPAASTTPEQNFDLSPEETEMYGEFAPVAEKLIAKATAPLIREIEDLRKQTGAVDERVGHTSEAMFVRDVRSRVDGFDTVTRTPEWQTYLARRIPMTAMTVRDALMDAHSARDLDRVSSIFDAFAQERAPAPEANADGAATTTQASGTPPATGLGQFATPDRTAANPSGKPKPKFRNSDYARNVAAMRAGRMSKVEFMQFEADFDKARTAGLVSKE
ncbi:hypothetical protein SAMN05444172_2583 [Burkholderia sp. GAS332]|nr:hypothetical protein SAMN05444172_2583 [Burkholderia sp. GAS332]